MTDKITAILDEGERIKNNSTEVVAWYPHELDGTVRGPFGRWFKAVEVHKEYKEHVSPITEDVIYCAHALTNYPKTTKALRRAAEEINKTVCYCESETYACSRCPALKDILDILEGR